MRMLPVTFEASRPSRLRYPTTAFPDAALSPVSDGGTSTGETA